MALTKDDLEAMKTTGSAKFVDTLAARTNRAYEAIITRDTFGSAGYVPFLLGGAGSGQEWTGSRLMKSMRSYGVRYNGKRYENSRKFEIVDLADDPAMAAARIAARMATSAALHEEKSVYNLLKSNAIGFDGEPLFGEHEYTDEDGTNVLASYSNDIAGTGPAWYLCNSESLIDATREGEDYTFQSIGGDGDSEFTFINDAVAMGWRARKIFAPGYWANSIRSKASLNQANLQEAIVRAASFKGDDGELLNNGMTHLVVPRALEADANKLIKAMLVNGGDTNIDYNRLQVIVSDLL